MPDHTTKIITLQGTPVELGMQIATSLLTKPLEFAKTQLSPSELEDFCCSLLSTTGALIARQIGRDRAALLTATLAAVAEAEAEEHQQRGPLQ